MKHLSPRRPSAPAALGLALALALAFAASSAHAASGTWNVDADGNWTTTTNWLSNTIAGNNAGDVANFTFGLTANRTVTVESTNKIIGSLNIGDSDNTHSYIIGGGVSIYFNNGSNDAQINQLATSKGDTINAPIAISGNGSLTITNASSNTLTMGSYTQSGSAGAKTLTVNNTGAVIYSGYIVNGGSDRPMAVVKSGSGSLRLSGTNTYTGGTTLNAGTLEIGNASALGTGNFTINGGVITTTAARTLGTNNTQTWNADFTFGTTGTSGFDLNLGTGAVSLTGNRTVTVSSTSASRTLTVGGVISGSGFSLTKAGTATLALGGANDYTGNTIVSAGTLATLSTGTFGTGNISLTSSTSKLTLGNASSIADAATLTFSSTLTAAGSINLSFTGTETLAGIYRSGGAGGSIVAGLYTADELNAFFNTTIFTGGGSFQFGAVPEPSSYAAILGGLALAGVMFRRRR